MPELPEVETVRKGLARVLDGATIRRVTLRRGDLRRAFPPDFAERLAGRRIENLGRRAKYLVADLDSGESLVMHLGMSGSFRIETAGTKQPPLQVDPRHDHVIFDLEAGDRVIYNDPRRFGSMDLVATSALAATPPFDKLGIEPLSPELTPGWLAKRLAGKATSIKAALMDQRLIAGLGNIYVCEALWRAGISPKRDAGTLADRGGRPTAACKRLPGAIRDVLKDAIASGGSSLRNHVLTDGSLGEFQHHFKVYDREGAPCPRPGCGSIVRRIVQNGRSTYYCPKCQK